MDCEHLRFGVFQSPFKGAAESLALEQVLLAGKGYWFFLRRNDPCISIGFNQDLECEVNVGLARDMGIDIVRRRTGGGAVFRDAGCISYSFILPDRLKDDAVGIVIDALADLGVALSRTGRNDLFFGEKKVSGYAWSESADRALVHGTVLFSTDIDLMNALLGQGKRKYVGTAMRSVTARVANLSSSLPGVTVDDFQDRLQYAMLGRMHEIGWDEIRCAIREDVLAEALTHVGEYRI